MQKDGKRRQKVEDKQSCDCRPVVESCLTGMRPWSVPKTTGTQRERDKETRLCIPKQSFQGAAETPVKKSSTALEQTLKSLGLCYWEQTSSAHSLRLVQLSGLNAALKNTNLGVPASVGTEYS